MFQCIFDASRAALEHLLAAVSFISAIRLIQIKLQYTELIIIFNLNLIANSILLVTAQPYLILSSSLGFTTVHQGLCISSFLRYAARPRAPLGVKRSGSGSAVEQVRYE